MNGEEEENAVLDDEELEEDEMVEEEEEEDEEDDDDGDIIMDVAAAAAAEASTTAAAAAQPLPPPVLVEGQAFATRPLARQAVRAFAAAQGKSVRIHQATNAGSTFAFVCKSATPCGFEVKLRRPNRRTSSVHVITAAHTAHGPECTGKPLKRLAAAAAGAPARPARRSHPPVTVTLADGTALTLRERMEFGSREALKDFVHDFALAQGKRARVDRASSGGNNSTFVCTSATPCGFNVRTLRSKTTGLQYVRSFDPAHGAECTGRASLTKRQVLNHMQKLEAPPALSLTGADVQAMVKSLQGADVSARVASDARVALVGRALQDATTGIQKLESLLARFQALNPTAGARVDFDTSGVFQRAFLKLPHAARVQSSCPRVLGLVETPMGAASNLLHGVLLELVAKDANNSAHTLAVGLSDVRSTDTYAWFLSCCVASEIAFSAPLICDRHSGILSAVEALPTPFTLLQCTQSLMANLERRLELELSPDVRALILRAQDADSDAEYRSALDDLRAAHALVAEQLRALDANTWAKHCYVGRLPLFGCQSASLVSSTEPPAAASLACDLGPFELFQSYMERCMKAWYEGKRNARSWAAGGKRTLTAFAENVLKAHEQSALACRVVPSDAEKGIAYVWDPRAPVLKKCRVNLSMSSCTCPVLEQLELPCKHILAAANRFNADGGSAPWSVAQLGRAVYSVQRYADLYSSVSPIELPLEEELARNLRVRITPNGTSNRCSLCHEIGHNRRRCTQEVASAPAPPLPHDARVALI